MATNSPQPKEHDCAFSALDTLIQILDIAKVACVFPPAQAAISSTSALLTMIKDSAANKQDYVELGKSCARVCRALDRGLDGRRPDVLSQSVLEAIGQLTTTVAGIQRKIVARGKRNQISRALHAKDDKDAIMAWGRDLDRILNIFNVELSMNNHTILLDIRRDVQVGQGGADGRHQPTQASVPLGELPPPPPRACFGRDELIKKIVGLAESLNPIALIGPGGIGKTSVALAVLHNDNIRDRFGHNRRFIRCDQFSASRTNFLSRLSKAIGAGVENPEDLTPLRPFLSSQKIFIILDNAESILDPQGTDGQEIYRVVKELSQLDSVSLCITSRITTVPPDCKRLDVPTLSMDAAHSTFYRIYDNNEESGRIGDILRQLDFHPLSVTLLATVARQNEWGNNRLVREWERYQTGILKTEHNESLAVAIELSLASPMFQLLGPDARGLLGVVAFFPQGVDENNLEWLFPTTFNINTIFDKFCILSLTYRSNGFITMLAPLRDYLCPKDPKASALLCTTKDLYATRLSVSAGPNRPGFDDARWITSEDLNVEHLLNVFASVDPNSEDIWAGCMDFVGHLNWHKPRQTVLGPKIKQLPDGHRWKPKCLFMLAGLSDSVGNNAEGKQLLIQALQLWRERGDSDYWVGCTLERLADANRWLGLHEEGIQQAREALEIFERVGDTAGQADCLSCLARLFLKDGRLDEAEEVTISSINLLGKGQEFQLCESHRILGNLFSSKGESEKAIHNYDMALGIADQFNWHDQLFWIHYALGRLFLAEDKFDDAEAHIKQAKQHTLNDEYFLGRAMEGQAKIWYKQGRLEDAASEALSAIEIYGKLGAANDTEDCRALLQNIERSMEEPSITSKSDSNARGASSSTSENAHSDASHEHPIP